MAGLMTNGTLMRRGDENNHILKGIQQPSCDVIISVTSTADKVISSII